MYLRIFWIRMQNLAPVFVDGNATTGFNFDYI